MPYLGRSSQKAIRQRFIFTQSSSGATSISGADDSNATLRFDDGEYVDVILNGITLAKTEYNTLTANTIGGLAALSSGDVLQVTVYDMFNVADTVKASTGGTFNGGVTINGDLTVTGSGAGAAGVVSASTSGTAISIDSSNRVTTPARPAFRARNDPSSATSVTGVITFNVEDFDIGGNYDTSNGRFTAPVAGIYYFCFDALVTNDSANQPLASGNSVRATFVKNGSEFAGSQRAYYRIDGATQYNTIYRTDLIQLAVNDYIQVNITGQYIYRDTTGYYDPVFQGHLVG